MAPPTSWPNHFTMKMNGKNYCLACIVVSLSAKLPRRHREPDAQEATATAKAAHLRARLKEDDVASFSELTDEIANERRASAMVEAHQWTNITNFKDLHLSGAHNLATDDKFELSPAYKEWIVIFRHYKDVLPSPGAAGKMQLTIEMCNHLNGTGKRAAGTTGVHADMLILYAFATSFSSFNMMENPFFSELVRRAGATMRSRKTLTTRMHDAAESMRESFLNKCVKGCVVDTSMARRSVATVSSVSSCTSTVARRSCTSSSTSARSATPTPPKAARPPLAARRSRTSHPCCRGSSPRSSTTSVFSFAASAPTRPQTSSALRCAAKSSCGRALERATDGCRAVATVVVGVVVGTVGDHLLLRLLLRLR